MNLCDNPATPRPSALGHSHLSGRREHFVALNCFKCWPGAVTSPIPIPIPIPIPSARGRGNDNIFNLLFRHEKCLKEPPPACLLTVYKCTSKDIYECLCTRLDLASREREHKDFLHARFLVKKSVNKLLLLLLLLLPFLLTYFYTMLE